MPIYEYKCKDCGKVIEFFQQSWKQKESLVCPDCSSINLTKLISTPGIVRIGDSSPKDTTCCGREERCDTPPCSDDSVCRRDK